MRIAGQPEFEQHEVQLLADASSLFARAVRRGLVAEACAPSTTPNAPGVVELDAVGELIGASSSAEPLLAELSGDSPETGVRSAAIQAVASATRATIAKRTGGVPELPSSTVKTPAGTWLVLHGSLLGPPRAGQVAVFIQRAYPTLVAPTLLMAHGLSPREQQVAQLTLRGATTAQMAQRLGISPHTVNDHMKAIFAKTGASTRGELSATLFFGEHLPRIQGQVAIGDDASFVDAPRPRLSTD